VNEIDTRKQREKRRLSLATIVVLTKQRAQQAAGARGGVAAVGLSRRRRAKVAECGLDATHRAGAALGAESRGAVGAGRAKHGLRDWGGALDVEGDGQLPVLLVKLGLRLDQADLGVVDLVGGAVIDAVLLVQGVLWLGSAVGWVGGGGVALGECREIAEQLVSRLFVRAGRRQGRRMCRCPSPQNPARQPQPPRQPLTSTLRSVRSATLSFLRSTSRTVCSTLMSATAAFL